MTDTLSETMARDPRWYLPKYDTVEEERLHRKQRLARRRSACSASSASTRASPATSPPATRSDSTTSG